MTRTLLRRDATPRRPRRAASSRHLPVQTSRLRVEGLESRLVPSADPLLFATLAENLDWADTPGEAALLATAPMSRSAAQGALSGAADVDVLRVELTKGDVLTAELGRGADAARLFLQDGEGRSLTAGGASFLSHRIAATGAYFLGVAARDGAAGARYELDVRRIGLDDSFLGHDRLDEEGDMYAWLDGDKLAVSGPSGHGFRLRSEG
jgi:hypothetical protein